MELITITDIESKILSFRGVQVMLDKDLAIFYEIKTIRLREQVKRNPDRFPDEFTFQLNDYEDDLLVTQNAIPSRKHLGGSNPFVFTEQGLTKNTTCRFFWRPFLEIKIILSLFSNDIFH